MIRMFTTILQRSLSSAPTVPSSTAFEVTPAFAAAVIIADIVGNAQPVTIDVLAVLFVTSRMLYIICYLADWAILRSIVWFTGMGLVVSFFFVS